MIMPSCCSTEKNLPVTKRHICPKNHQQYGSVPYATVLHHIKRPWNISATQQNYYFCSDPQCDVAYFGIDDTLILKQELRTKIGIKEPSVDTCLLCYCFGVTRHQAATDKSIKAFVVKQTKNGLCACSSYNPSGKCCLKDFPK
jgi:hypothetical protein